MTKLPLENCTVNYYKKFVGDDLADEIYKKIKLLFDKEERNVVKSQDKKYKLNRKTIAFVDLNIDANKLLPKIWGDDITILPFDHHMLKLKHDVEDKTNFKFNICLANYYSSGKRSIGFHSDSEEKGSTSCIASISIGQDRLFSFRNKGEKNPIYSIMLESHSLLTMETGCQENYEHALLADKTIEPRLNLTFRLFDSERYHN